MGIEVVTKQDLEEFRVKLLNDLKNAILKEEKPTANKWLRSHEVRKLLNISQGTLQNLCIKKVLVPKKIGTLNYYNTTEIEKILN